METDRTRDTRKNGSALGLALSASSAHTSGTEDEEATAGSGSGAKASPRAWRRRAWTAWGGSKKQAKDSPVGPASEKQTNDSGGSGSTQGGVAVCAAFHAERSAAQLPVPEGEREF